MHAHKWEGWVVCYCVLVIHISVAVFCLFLKASRVECLQQPQEQRSAYHQHLELQEQEVCVCVRGRMNKSEKRRKVFTAVCVCAISFHLFKPYVCACVFWCRLLETQTRPLLAVRLSFPSTMSKSGRGPTF